ncbi:MAG: hypothetical protein L0956_09955 [Candidatus Mariimomonas ferrooxydans]
MENMGNAAFLKKWLKTTAAEKAFTAWFEGKEKVPPHYLNQQPHSFPIRIDSGQGLARS